MGGLSIAAPVISNAPDDLVISYGVTAYMTCTAFIGATIQGADQLTSTLSWVGPNGQQIVNASDNTINVYTEDVTQGGQVFIKSYLKVCNFTQSNTGQYSCRVSNANGMDDKNWTASLPYRVTAPQLLAQPSTRTATEGNTVYMTCAAYGYPFPEVTWYKDGQVVGREYNGRLSVSTNIVNYNGALVVQSDVKLCRLSIEDIGTYSCSFSTRDFGTVRSQDWSLDVLPGMYVVIIMFSICIFV